MDLYAPWTDAELALYLIERPVLTALARGDLATARALCPKPLVLTDFLVSPKSMWTWNYRDLQLQATPSDAVWVTRFVVHSATHEVIGCAGFHGAPDSHRGMVEIGYKIAPDHQRKGHGTAVVQILLAIARYEAAVRVVRASIGLTNSISRDMVTRCGFVKVGEEMDEVDGLEEVYELDLRGGPHAPNVALEN